MHICVSSAEVRRVAQALRAWLQPPFPLNSKKIEANHSSILLLRDLLYRHLLVRLRWKNSNTAERPDIDRSRKQPAGQGRFLAWKTRPRRRAGPAVAEEQVGQRGPARPAQRRRRRTHPALIRVRPTTLSGGAQ
jgi:hypothetical protein